VTRSGVRVPPAGPVRDPVGLGRVERRPHCATASAAVGQVAVVGGIALVVDEAFWASVVSDPFAPVGSGSIRLAARVLGPSGPTAVSGSESASVVYYGWHIYPVERIR